MFDTVPHERLLIKLEAYGVIGNINKWISDSLGDRQQLVRVGEDVRKNKGDEWYSTIIKRPIVYSFHK